MRDTIREMFPQLAEILDAKLREKVIDVWEDAMKNNQWTREELEAIPFTLLAGDIDMRYLEHVRCCVQMCIAVAGVLKNVWGSRMPIHRDHLIAGALLADVGKLVEFDRRDGKVVKGHRGEMLRHPFSGVGLCWKHGLPDEVMHIVATHSKEGDHVQRTPESLIFHHVDFIDFDIACFLGKKK
ncbi:MAG: hypothetical protein HJJLKODD_02404 [Phycisphaerae bacterium]|nr:hypothetical protein [Phycisphaerae bacterium]